MDNRRSNRIAEIMAEAERTFSSSEKAQQWMAQRNAALGKTPLSMLETEAGACEVRKILASIAHGGVV